MRSDVHGDYTHNPRENMGTGRSLVFSSSPLSTAEEIGKRPQFKFGIRKSRRRGGRPAHETRLWRLQRNFCDFHGDVLVSHLIEKQSSANASEGRVVTGAYHDSCNRQKWGSAL